jgi:hypothetical protein
MQGIHRLASYIVRAPNPRSGGHEFESPVRHELSALTKSGKTLGVRSFYNPYLYNAEGEKCLVSKVLFANFEEKRA